MLRKSELVLVLTIDGEVLNLRGLTIGNKCEPGVARYTRILHPVRIWFNCLNESLHCTPTAHGLRATVVKNDIGWSFGLLDDGRHEFTGQSLNSNWCRVRNSVEGQSILGDRTSTSINTSAESTESGGTEASMHDRPAPSEADRPPDFWAATVFLVRGHTTSEFVLVEIG